MAGASDGAVWRAAALCALLACAVSGAGETLYNGIRLPAEWPPRIQQLTAQPAGPPPYLVTPPAVIPIDVGRQLFTDDFLIESTTLRRVFQRAEYFPGNPVMEADRPWERKDQVSEAMVY
ncbi:MAG: hypothetical protein NTY38_11345, partial [Acidobacteria bacterium]|nr:hypothetical protein [Acidobacteriota bacterium]